MEQTDIDIGRSSHKAIHTFHIPVLGIGFTIDTPLRVAKYGISSVISLVDDVIIEQMRKFHCEKEGEPYEEITNNAEDSRARRITAYLNLLDLLVSRQVVELQNSPFEPGSEITRYYEMLPETPLKRAYKEMLAMPDIKNKSILQEKLRALAMPGSIDVNIMTKLDSDFDLHGKKLPPGYSDAMAALRGYANSALESSIIFSAGLNQRLYSSLTCFSDFFPDKNKIFKKKIVLKVSDYRSALIQGKLLAKHGLWVSEYRIESGLNCGGHAFPTKGFLLGPVLEEFKSKKGKFISTILSTYNKALAGRNLPQADAPYGVRFTVQGGIGTADEDTFLREYYGVDGTGWGTLFLLVPEVINIDDESLKSLADATSDDVYLSDSSPLDIPFWNLRNSASEEARRHRIQEGKPGSPCCKSHALTNMEFTKHPICTASRLYQKRKLSHLQKEPLSEKERVKAIKRVLVKSCICHDLSGGVALKHRIDAKAKPAVCCGPSIVDFSKIATLEEMVSHIYGRLSLLTNSKRPHMFVQEIKIYSDYLQKEVEKFSAEVLSNTSAYFRDFKDNLLKGIDYYRQLAENFIEEQRERFLQDLESLCEEIKNISLYSCSPTPEFAKATACRP